jgi:hypothetical protein
LLDGRFERRDEPRRMIADHGHAWA